jgi:hypothetical protein
MTNVVYCNDNILLKIKNYYALSIPSTCNPTHLPSSHTGIANSGANGIYFAPDGPVANLNLRAPALVVQVANSFLVRLIANATLASAPSLPYAATQGHVMPFFPHTLVSLAQLPTLTARSSSPRRKCPSFIPTGIAS